MSKTVYSSELTNEELSNPFEFTKEEVPYRLSLLSKKLEVSEREIAYSLELLKSHPEVAENLNLSFSMNLANDNIQSVKDALKEIQELLEREEEN